MSRSKGSQKKFHTPPEDTVYFQDQRYILYIRQTQKASREAKKVAAPILEYQVHVIDVDELEERPAWLRGTPTLVDVNRKKAFMGSAVLDELNYIITTDDGTGPRTACQPSGWLKGMARIDPDLDDDPAEKAAFLSDRKGISDGEVQRYNRMRAESGTINEPPAGAGQGLGQIDMDLDEDMGDYFTEDMDRKLSSRDVEAYVEQRNNQPRRRGPPTARSAGVPISDSRRKYVTDDKIQRHLKKRQQVPQRTALPRRGEDIPQRRRPATKRRRL